MSNAKEFYQTMWNPIYEDTEHPQFSYKELIEFAEEYEQHCRKSEKSDLLPNVSFSLPSEQEVESMAEDYGDQYSLDGQFANGCEQGYKAGAEMMRLKIQGK